MEELIRSWKEARAGLIEEVARIPENQFAFKPTPETRSIAEILQHVIETQKVLVGEACRPDSNLMRQSFGAHMAEYAPGVKEVHDKNGLLELLRSSMELAEATIRSYGDLEVTMKRFDGRDMPKLEFLRFAQAHEMYHRGQLTVYERLLNIEPALTEKFKKLFAQAQ